MSTEKWVLISVYNKAAIVEFVQSLVKLGWKILASGGTAKVLTQNKIDVKDVAELVGGGAILDHRVVTLSREIHAGLLARDNEEDRAELEKLGVPFINMVVCDFYPLSEEIAKPDATLESVIEKTDIGGPTMVRSAAKGGRIVVADPNDRQLVIEQLEILGDIRPETSQYLRAKAEFIVAQYCLDSARFHSEGGYDGILGIKFAKLAYGENRDQSPAFFFQSIGVPDDLLDWSHFQVISGQPSYISMADGDRVLQIVRLMAEAFRQNFGKVPFISVACKHGNPCGAAIDWNDPAEALLKTLLGDPAAVMGGEVMTNFPITDELGQLLFAVPDDLQERVGRNRWGLDVVYAPEFSPNSFDLLGKREKRRLLYNSALLAPSMPPNQWVWRSIQNGWLVQKAQNYVLTLQNIRSLVCSQEKREIDLPSLIIAWAVAWRSVSNTVALAKNEMLIGLGCGQQDRMACVQLCLDRAKRSGHNAKGSVAASDGFFPFACRKEQDDPLEGPELLANAGCTTVVVPADGKKFEEVSKFFFERDIMVAFLEPNHRGFFGH